MWKRDIDTFGPMDSNTTTNTNYYDNSIGIVLLLLAGIIICWFGIPSRSNNNYERI